MNGIILCRALWQSETPEDSLGCPPSSVTHCSADPSAQRQRQEGQSVVPAPQGGKGWGMLGALLTVPMGLNLGVWFSMFTGQYKERDATDQPVGTTVNTDMAIVLCSGLRSCLRSQASNRWSYDYGGALIPTQRDSTPEGAYFTPGPSRNPSLDNFVQANCNGEASTFPRGIKGGVRV